MTLGSAVPYNRSIRTAEFSGRSMCASYILSNPQFSGSPAVRSSTAFAAGTSEEFPGAVQGAYNNSMKRTFIATAMFAVVLSISALAQSSSPAPGGAAATPAMTPATSAPSGGLKIATIDMQGAVAATNEGARDFEALNKKFEPRRTELQNLNTEIENLKKQLNTQGDKMNEEARASLVKSIETKQKSLQRSAEDAQNEYQQQGSEIAQRLLQKMAPIIDKYVKTNGYGLLIDSSSQWPQGPVVMTTAQMDITKAIIDAYNAQSGVAPPASASGAKPSGTAFGKPATSTTTPATKPPAPATTTKPH